MNERKLPWAAKDWSLSDLVAVAPPRPPDRRGPSLEVLAIVEAAVPMGTFQVLARDILLSDHSARLKVSARTRGDVAQVDDGRLVARIAGIGRDGSPIYATAPYDPTVPVDKVGYPSPVDPWSLISAPTAEPERFLQLEPEAEAKELAKFRAEFPYIAARLGLETPYQFRLFEPGVVTYERTFRRTGVSLSAEVVRAYVHQHTIGEHGLYGEHKEEPLSPSQSWELDRLPVEVQSRAAIMSGRGVVRSRFVLCDEDQSRIRIAAATEPGQYNLYSPSPTSRACLDVVTVLGRSGARTLCTFTMVEQPQP